MASKFQFITELYDNTVLEITSNPKNWMDFLRAASFNYKCSFDEQVLIYAQRPDATAVLELEKWNRQFGRWINKGATGIAVFDEQSGHGRLKHYFDVADTHQSRISSPLPIWKMEIGLPTAQKKPTPIGRRLMQCGKCSKKWRGKVPTGRCRPPKPPSRASHGWHKR